MKKLQDINLNVKEIKGVFVVDSREVAQMIGKDHKNLLRDIRRYCSALEDGSKLNSHGFFIESNYINSQNKPQPCYLLTKKGCDMVSNKMTGNKGILFTAEYVTKFEEMENQIKHKPIVSIEDMIIAQANSVKEIKNKLNIVNDNALEARKEVKELREGIPLFNVECDELQKLLRKKVLSYLGYKTPAYTDKSLRTTVFQDIQKEVKRQFNVRSYKAIKRGQFEKAKDIIENYRLPLYLEDQVNLLNSKIQF